MVARTGVVPIAPPNRLAYTENSMAARLVAFVLAFVMTGAPVLTTACQTACATREMVATPLGNHEHHSCHAVAPSNEMAISGLGHACGHIDNGDQFDTDRSVRMLSAAAIVVVALTPLIVQAPRFVSRSIAHNPPGPLSLITQLRV
jgi:hypothetical protein